ncbi:MAG: hypothetical protein ACI9MR_003413 [Myxococcota bacterium]|jgi:hypothetical protein
MINRRNVFAAFVTFLFTAVPSGAAVAGDDDLEVGGSIMTGLTSTYVFQGKNKGDAPLSPMWMTNARLGLDNLGPGELSVGLGALMPITADGGGFELHPSVGYDLTLGIVELELLYSLHLTPEEDATDNGHYFEAEATVGESWVVKPSVGVTWEPVRTEAVYLFAKHSASGLIGSSDVVRASLQGALQSDASTDLGFADLSLDLSWTHLIGWGGGSPT